MELTTTVPVDAVTAKSIEARVRQFPEDKRVRVAVTEELSPALPAVPPALNPPLANFLQRLDDALAPLREAEQD